MTQLSQLSRRRDFAAGRVGHAVLALHPKYSIVENSPQYVEVECGAERPVQIMNALGGAEL